MKGHALCGHYLFRQSNKLKFKSKAAVCMNFWISISTLPFVTMEGGTHVTVWPLISHITPCNDKQFSTCSHETLSML